MPRALVTRESGARAAASLLKHVDRAHVACRTVDENWIDDDIGSVPIG
jgi:hypothetical protein